MRFYPLFSGSSGNCSVVEHEGTRLLVDAGVSARTIAHALTACSIQPESITAILVTHEHSDHIKGVGVLSRMYDLPVYANNGTWVGMEKSLGDIAQKNIRMFETERDFFINDINVLPFSIPHDTNEPVGYTFCVSGKKLSVATDIGHVTTKIVDALDKSDLILLEANHDVEMLKSGRYPYALKQRILGTHGHLSNENCGKLLVKLYSRGTQRAILGHLSRENNTEQLAMETVSNELAAQDIFSNSIHLHIAHPDRVCGIFEI